MRNCKQGTCKYSKYRKHSKICSHALLSTSTTCSAGSRAHSTCKHSRQECTKGARTSAQGTSSRQGKNQSHASALRITRVLKSQANAPQKHTSVALLRRLHIGQPGSNKRYHLSIASTISQHGNQILLTHGALQGYTRRHYSVLRDKGSQLKHPPKGITLQHTQPGSGARVLSEPSSSPHTPKTHTASRHLPQKKTTANTKMLMQTPRTTQYCQHSSGHQASRMKRPALYHAHPPPLSSK